MKFRRYRPDNEFGIYIGRLHSASFKGLVLNLLPRRDRKIKL